MDRLLPFNRPRNRKLTPSFFPTILCSSARGADAAIVSPGAPRLAPDERNPTARAGFLWRFPGCVMGPRHVEANPCFCFLPPALLVASAFRAVERMKGRSCGKPAWAVAALFIPLTLLMLTPRGASSSQKMSQAAMARATVAAAGSGPGLTDSLPGLQAVVGFTSSERAHVWLLSLVGSVAVGLSGIFPLLVIPVEAGAALKTEGKARRPRRLARERVFVRRPGPIRAVDGWTFFPTPLIRGRWDL